MCIEVGAGCVVGYDPVCAGVSSYEAKFVGARRREEASRKGKNGTTTDRARRR